MVEACDHHRESRAVVCTRQQRRQWQLPGIKRSCVCSKNVPLATREFESAVAIISAPKPSCIAGSATRARGCATGEHSAAHSLPHRPRGHLRTRSFRPIGGASMRGAIAARGTTASRGRGLRDARSGVACARDGGVDPRAQVHQVLIVARHADGEHHGYTRCVAKHQRDHDWETDQDGERALGPAPAGSSSRGDGAVRRHDCHHTRSLTRPLCHAVCAQRSVHGSTPLLRRSRARTSAPTPRFEQRVGEGARRSLCTSPRDSSQVAVGEVASPGVSTARFANAGGFRRCARPRHFSTSHTHARARGCGTAVVPSLTGVTAGWTGLVPARTLSSRSRRRITQDSSV